MMNAMAPDNITDVEGGVERACCLVILAEILLAAIYAYFFWTGYERCLGVKYLSIGESPPDNCNEVTRGM